jgi:hypothetical protein
MPSRTARLLRAGNDPELLQTRYAFQAHAGYGAQAATLPEAETLLRTEQFDLIVVSAWLSESERSSILSVCRRYPHLRVV